MQGQVEVRGDVGIHTEKLGWRHADDRERKIVNQDRCADGVSRTSEAPLTKAVADNYYGRRSRPVIIGIDQSAGRRGNTKTPEIVAGHISAASLVGLSLYA